MKINEYNGMMKYLTRPKAKKEDILQFIDYYKGKFGTDEALDAYKKKYAKTANLYDDSEDPRYVSPRELEDIKKSLPVSEMVKKPKIKKTLVVEKPKPPVISLLEFEDWIGGIDPNYIEKPEEEVLLHVPRSKAEGIRSILKLHKKVV